MRERYYLEYWMQDQHHCQWVCEFRELSDQSIEFQDYVTKRATTIKSDRTIVYRVTRFE
jgi:hypothetical protein